MTLVLAIDAGGTSTRAMVVQADGTCLGFGRAGGGNPTASGVEAAAASVAAASATALTEAGIQPDAVASATLAMAGMSTTDVRTRLMAALAAHGLRPPVRFENDIVATFATGTSELHGYALVAGTGAAAIRVEHGQCAAVADGLGWLVGDAGSGFWLGQQIVRAALEDLDHRGPSTALTPLVLDAFGLEADVTADRTEMGRPAAVQTITNAVYAAPPVALARLARLAVEASDDPVARRLLDEASALLARTLRSVYRPDAPGPIVLGGGTVRYHPTLPARLRSALHAPTAEVTIVTDGAVGAGVLALRGLGVEVDAEVHTRLRSTLAAQT
ncbi:MAG TPA: BadF/BadG/BcrA/BcrD ATPase family protein [Candidatus Lumbricidophila sp.]|nr:BadF/BadG/BcrA/BcrD ATPase family protein [Candidatus Lumbricidophila sp.]